MADSNPTNTTKERGFVSKQYLKDLADKICNYNNLGSNTYKPSAMPQLIQETPYTYLVSSWSSVDDLTKVSLNTQGAHYVVFKKASLKGTLGALTNGNYKCAVQPDIELSSDIGYQQATYTENLSTDTTNKTATFVIDVTSPHSFDITWCTLNGADAPYIKGHSVSAYPSEEDITLYGHDSRGQATIKLQEKMNYLQGQLYVDAYDSDESTIMEYNFTLNATIDSGAPNNVFLFHWDPERWNDTNLNIYAKPQREGLNLYLAFPNYTIPNPQTVAEGETFNPNGAQIELYKGENIRYLDIGGSYWISSISLHNDGDAQDFTSATIDTVVVRNTKHTNPNNYMDIEGQTVTITNLYVPDALVDAYKTNIAKLTTLKVTNILPLSTSIYSDTAGYFQTVSYRGN